MPPPPIGGRVGEQCPPHPDKSHPLDLDDQLGSGRPCKDQIISGAEAADLSPNGVVAGKGGEGATGEVFGCNDGGHSGIEAYQAPIEFGQDKRELRLSIPITRRRKIYRLSGDEELAQPPGIGEMRLDPPPSAFDDGKEPVRALDEPSRDKISGKLHGNVSP